MNKILIFYSMAVPLSTVLMESAPPAEHDQGFGARPFFLPNSLAVRPSVKLGVTRCDVKSTVLLLSSILTDTYMYLLKVSGTIYLCISIYNTLLYNHVYPKMFS